MMTSKYLYQSENVKQMIAEKASKVRIVFQINEDKPALPAMWIESGIHCREWITMPTVIYLLEQVEFFFWGGGAPDP